MTKFRFEYRIALLYLIVGFLYIILSDIFLNSISKDSEFITKMQTYKGIGYVVVTALLLFFLMRGHLLQLHQLVLNVLVNAVQSIDAPGTITIATHAAQGRATVTISDTGCGISKKDIGRITDPFFTTKPPGEGVGIGLSIAYNIGSGASGIA